MTDPIEIVTERILAELLNYPLLRAGWDRLAPVTHAQIRRRIAGILRRHSGKRVPVRGEVK